MYFDRIRIALDDPIAREYSIAYIELCAARFFHLY